MSEAPRRVTTQVQSSASGRVSGSGSGEGLVATGLHALQPGQRFRLASGHEFECVRLLGRGGMGVVFLVRDLRIGRQAALKLHIPQHGGGSREARFRRETVVTACLDHPHIPPVYEVGKTPDGQDFLLMRFVDGRALGDVLGELPLREAVSVLIKVGEAVAYANSRGVVHRDLKPDNVMVGKFGEVLVMDWGLARLQRESVEHDQRLRDQLGEETAGPELTRAGAFMGTLGYMAPEQARGEDVDARSDVFALGAILCQAVSGSPPVRGTTAMELLTRTGAGQLDLPGRGSAPRELLSVLRCALAVDPEDRYPDAAALVQDLQAFLEDRPLAAHRYGALQQLLRAVRRHPALATGLAVALVLVVFALAMTTRARERARRATLSAARAEARRDFEGAWEALAAVRSGSTEERLGLSLAALQAAQRWRAVADEDPEAAEGLGRAACELGEVALRGEQWSLARQAYSLALAPGVPERSRAEEGLANVEVERHAEDVRREQAVDAILADVRAGQLGARARGREEALIGLVRYAHPRTVTRLCEVLDELSQALAWTERQAYLEVAKPSPAEAAAGQRELVGLEQALAARAAGGEPGRAHRELLAQAEVRLLGRSGRRSWTQGKEDDGVRMSSFAQTALSARSTRQLEDVLAERQTAGLQPAQLELLQLACEALAHLGSPELAGPALRRYLAVEHDGRRAATAAISLCVLGGDEALASVRAARDRFGDSGPFALRVGPTLARLEADLQPGAQDARAWRRRGDARRVLGRTGDALADYEEAVRLDPQDALAWNNLAVALLDAGRDPERAHQALERALARDPNLALAWSNRAFWRLANDPGPEGAARALDDCRRALELDPSLAHAWLTRCRVHLLTNEVDEAERDLARAVALDPGGSVVWCLRARVGLSRRDGPEAERDASHALDLDPGNAEALRLRGLARALLGQLEAALRDLDRAIELDPANSEGFTCRSMLRTSAGLLELALADGRRAVELAPRSAEACDAVGFAHLQGGRASEARVALDRAVELDPRLLQAWVHRGLVRMQQGDLAGAEADFTRAMELDPREAQAWANLGMVHLNAGRLEQARAAMDRALELDPNMAVVWVNRGVLRLRANDTEGALADLERGTALAPTLVTAWATLSVVQINLGRFEDAERSAERAIAADPGMALCWNNRGVARLKLFKLGPALDDFDQAIARDPGLAQAVENRALVQHRLKHPQEALQDAERTLQLTPASTTALFVRGMSRGEMGQRADAIKDLNAYLKRCPQGELAGEARSALERWKQP